MSAASNLSALWKGVKYYLFRASLRSSKAKGQIDRSIAKVKPLPLARNLKVLISVNCLESL